MSIKIKEFASYIESIAPLELQEGYDNSGLSIGDMNDEIKGIMVALDVTMDVIKEAEKKGANLIFSHHPLLFLKPKSITSETLQGKKILELIRNGINVYSAHTNLDSTKDGLNDIILELLGLGKGRIIENKIGHEDSGIGRIVNLNESKTVKEICRDMRLKLQVPFLRVVGDMNKKITSIAVINGSGESYFESARVMGADLIITGDTSYHFVSDYKEMGISIIDIGHFSCEWPLFKKFSEKISVFLRDNGDDIPVYLSEDSKDPYSVY